MKPEVMVDLETLATDNDAVVVAIGAVKFNPETKELIDEKFYSTLNWTDQFNKGRSVHPATVRWWLSQTPEAVAAIMVPPPSESNATVLSNFAEYMKGTDGLWGNGVDFDCSILVSLYNTYNQRVPWGYPQHRCFRTIKNMYGREVQPERQGTHHNALDDAVHQAVWLMEILKRIKV